MNGNDIKGIFSENDAKNLFYYGREDSDEKFENAIGMMSDRRIESSVFETIGIVFAREYRNVRAKMGEPAPLTDRQLAEAFNLSISIADSEYCLSGGMYAPCLRNAFDYICYDFECRIAA